MESTSSSVYNSSLLDNYMNPSQLSLPKLQERQPSNLRYETNGNLPQINIISENNSNMNRTQQIEGNQNGLRLNSSRSSVHSCASSSNSVFSAVSDVSQDDEVNKVNLAVNANDQNGNLPLSLSVQFEKQYEEEQRKYALKQNKFKTLFSNAHGHKNIENFNIYSDNLSNQRYFNYINNKLNEDYYSYSSKQTLNLNWYEICEVYLYGDLLKKIYPSNEYLMQYLFYNQLESGELIFKNNLNNEDIININYSQSLKKLINDLNNFDEVLDLYSVNQQNLNSSKLFQIFKDFANHDGFSIPLAQAMFGNWLLSYNKDDTIDNNYDNELILTYFRKAARFSYAIKKLNDEKYFDNLVNEFNDKERSMFKTFLNKNNNFALGISLHNLGEYYQVHNEYDVAVNLWEINCHLTKDNDSGNLAILGMTDGFGFGNKFKTLNKLGKKSKTNKFNTKRRIAQLYRVLIKAGVNQEVGTSWVFKDKYD